MQNKIQNYLLYKKYIHTSFHLVRPSRNIAVLNTPAYDDVICHWQVATHNQDKHPPGGVRTPPHTKTRPFTPPQQ
jgi:hypothetical protein